MNDANKKVVIFGDIHGHSGPLMDLLEKTKAVVDGKKNPDVHVIQIGDLLHYGHDVYESDAECLALSLRFVDEQLYGNHDLPAFYGWAPGFMGQHHLPRPELGALIKEAKARNHFKVATAVDGYLVTHAGLSPSIWELTDVSVDDAVEAATQINKLFQEKQLNPDRPVAMFDAIGLARGGSSHHGGVFWEEWDELVRSYRTKPLLPQIVGHSARPGQEPEVTETGLINIDLEGIHQGWIGGIVRDPASVFMPVSVPRRPR